ncbi:MAG: shikimate kinase [Methanocalculus sp. MSAO_Arc1]|nr:shikimate kinase [Methanocalculus sp. MSAO_Arc1]MCP1662518.1 shikimate kinase [Methanocalculus sp. AMF5]RQD79678.1 MAG: shikimate kinase [Methanocalculus sp. MSAO_Arc1]
MTHPQHNIILIGMPGAGKSTVGVVLAKTLGMQFIDCDILIQQQSGRMLQEILDEDGPDAFRQIEEEVILSLSPRHSVIATGGSVIWSRAAMEHLKSLGVVVYLEISCSEMEKRIKNITTRGIVLLPDQTLREMYESRVPLYEQYADITIASSEKDVESVVRELHAIS